MMKNFKSLIIGMLFMSFFAFSSQAQEVAIKKAEVTNKVEIKVTGMTCAGCAGHVNKVLSETAGVKDHEVKYPGDVAVVTYDPKKITPKDIIAAIEENTNYTAELNKKKNKN